MKLITFVLSFLLFIPFPWQETYLFTRQVNVQVWKEKSSTYFNNKGKMPTVAGNKHLSILFSPHRLRVFLVSTEEVRAWSFRKKNQSSYSRAETNEKGTNPR